MWANWIIQKWDDFVLQDLPLEINPLLQIILKSLNFRNKQPQFIHCFREVMQTLDFSILNVVCASFCSKLLVAAVSFLKLKERVVIKM